jgi:hypothetical protein
MGPHEENEWSTANQFSIRAQHAISTKPEKSVVVNTSVQHRCILSFIGALKLDPMHLDKVFLTLRR